MPISKKASLLAILLIGIVAVVMKFLLDPFGSKESSVAVKQDEVVVEPIPTVPTKPVEPAPVAPTPAPVVPTAPAPAPAQPIATAPATAKKLSVSTSYGSPAGEEKVGFTLNVDANGIITGTETAVKATDDKSIKYQNAFKGGLSGAVVGKKLSDLTSIDKVGKASLTTNAFNKALSQLKSQM
jgi:hypothetical protein